MTASPRPKLKGFHVYCDESNTDSKKPYPVYGGILVPVNNLATVQNAITKWREDEKMFGELAWTKVVPGRSAKYRSLVDLFLTLSTKKHLVHFKAIVLDTRDPAYEEFSEGDDELGFYKFYYHFLLWYFANFAVKHDCPMEVIIDERTIKEDPYPILKIILNSGIRKKYNVMSDLVTRVEPLDSTRSDLLQLADVLMGAIGFHNMDFHKRPNARKAKVDLAHYIARRIHLYDLTCETPKYAEYFKVERWYWGPRPPRRRRPVDHDPRVSQ